MLITLDEYMGLAYTIHELKEEGKLDQMIEINNLDNLQQYAEMMVFMAFKLKHNA